VAQNGVLYEAEWQDVKKIIVVVNMSVGFR
jgi:hypothetical protein